MCQTEQPNHKWHLLFSVSLLVGESEKVNFTIHKQKLLEYNEMCLCRDRSEWNKKFLQI